MEKPPNDERKVVLKPSEDEVLRRILQTPPKPRKARPAKRPKPSKGK